MSGDLTPSSQALRATTKAEASIGAGESTRDHEKTVMLETKCILGNSCMENEITVRNNPGMSGIVGFPKNEITVRNNPGMSGIVGFPKSEITVRNNLTNVGTS